MSPELLLTCDLILRHPAALDEPSFTEMRALSEQETNCVSTGFQRLLASDGMDAWLLETKAGQELIGHLDWTEPNAPFVEIAPAYRLRGYGRQLSF